MIPCSIFEEIVCCFSVVGGLNVCRSVVAGCDACRLVVVVVGCDLGRFVVVPSVQCCSVVVGLEFSCSVPDNVVMSTPATRMFRVIVSSGLTLQPPNLFNLNFLPLEVVSR